MKNRLPKILIAVGVSLIFISAILFVFKSRNITLQNPQLTTSDWITLSVGVISLLAGLGGSVKDWRDLFKREKPAPPTVAFDIKDSNPQISTGKNARNIQAQVYIEKQVIQQAPESRRIESSNNGESSKPSGGSDIERKLNNGSRVRFLDALDSARFSSKLIYNESRLFSVVYVKVQFFFALICGDSIVVTENQLFDSLGFLEAFDELYNSSIKATQRRSLPIRVALREGNDVFQVVAKLFENKGFVLTLWEDLNDDIERRKAWASFIRDRRKPIGKVVKSKEKPLVEKLWKVLEYFTPDRCVRAETTDEFFKRVKRVIDLKDSELDALVTGIYDAGVDERRYFDTWDEVNAAKDLRNELIRIQGTVVEIKTRSQVRQQLENYGNMELRQGVIELTDGIYNQSLGIATNAMLVQNSTFPPQRNDYVAAGYALSTFINDKSNPSGDFVDSEIFSFDYFDNLQRLNDPKRKDELLLILETARNSTPWEKLIEMQESDGWKMSLVKFNETLSRLQLAVKKYKRGSFQSVERKRLEQELDNFRKELKTNWDAHIDNINDMLSNECWNITSVDVKFRHSSIGHVIRIPYSYLQPKIDREFIDGFRNWRNNPSFKGVLNGGVDFPV